MTIRLVKYSRSHKEYKLPVQRRACYEMYASSLKLANFNEITTCFISFCTQIMNRLRDGD